MKREDILINIATMNILDTFTGNCVISKEPISHNFDLDDFLRGHIFRLFSKDDVKQCEFKGDAPFKKIFVNYSSEDFMEISQIMGRRLYDIMETSIHIPPADVFIVEFSAEEKKWIAILKANYRTLYGHTTENNTVDIVSCRNLISTGATQLTEVAAIDTKTGKIRVAEKKFDVNGVKTNYFSSIFLQCRSEISDKAKAQIVKRSIDNILNKYYDDEEIAQKSLDIKSQLAERYEEEGVFDLSSMGEQIFSDNLLVQDEFNEKLDRYEIRSSQLMPLTDSVKKTLCTQEIVTETGIKIIIPLSIQNNRNNVEFSPLDGGSITIKNIGILKRK